MLRKLFLLFACLCLASRAAYAGEAAHIVFVVGQADVAGSPGKLGGVVSEGDDIVTGADGYIYMKTVDDGFLILRPSSRARVAVYHVDEQNPANSHFKLELQSGVARSISGQAVKKAKQNFRFNTPVAAIGVRGTDFTVYTDPEESRVTVISGGIVVSSFSGACSAEGGGPCEGPASRELYAGKVGQLLQIRRGQVPSLMKSNGLAPDLYAPPRNDEPLSKVAADGNAGLASTDLSLDSEKSSALISQTQTQPVTPVTPPVVVTPPAVTPPPPEAPEILWGRWKAIAGMPADSAALAKLNSGNYGGPSDVGPFFISRVNNTQLVMPTSGSASFALTDSEAYITPTGKSPLAATVSNAQFSVNFSQSTYATSLTLQAAGVPQMQVNSQGFVTNTGQLVSDIMNSNALLSGYLGGSNAQQAGYIFQTTYSPNYLAYGGTTWSKK